MNLNINAIRILCFGDSNTWGSIPDKSERFPADKRWTGVLQKELGDNYEIIEEGLSARTTNIDDVEHLSELRNGAKYLIPCLNSQIPLDYVVLFLGTNDLKARYNKSPEQIVEGVEELIKIILHMEYIHETIHPKIILIAPPLINDNEESLRGKFSGAEAKSKLLGQLYSDLASKYDLPFIDLSKMFPPMGHLKESVHQTLGELIAKNILGLKD